MLKIIVPSYQVNPHFKLSNIKIEINKGEIYSLIGKSGSGKSTVAKIAVGINVSNESSIISNDNELNESIDRLIPQFANAGYVPQSLRLKPHHTVREYLDLLLQKETKKSLSKSLSKYIELFHIQAILDSKIHQLSGGERQKLALIEAISKPIEYLVLDEPFSQLDTEQKLEFTNIIHEVIITKHIPCLLISHDLSDVIRLSHKIGITEKGKIIFQGDNQKFWKSKNTVVCRLKNAMITWKNQTDLLLKSQSLL
jgi:ABC-type multidrug transport system ATPase subunit